jgi:hypothetical protein
MHMNPSRKMKIVPFCLVRTVSSSCATSSPRPYSAIPGPDPNSFITCGSNGSVLLWDLRDTRSPARDFRGYSEAATYGDILSDGTKACESEAE